MLILKGFHVVFEMADGGTVRPPARYALCHDEDGRDWPRCSALVAPTEKVTSQPVAHPKAKEYFGHEPVAGSIAIPSGGERALGAWRKRGAVAEVLYTRRRPGGRPARASAEYYHPISGAKADLYEYGRGRWYRLELKSGCVWNWRGIVKP